MGRISPQALAAAVARIRSMNLRQKEQLADELFRAQPHVLASCLVQPRLGVGLVKVEFLLDTVLVCFQAMKNAPIHWPLITEDEQERQMQRLVATMRFGEDLPRDLSDRAMLQYIETHPEQYLLAFVYSEASAWLKRIAPEESDKFILLAAFNLVNCIAFVELPAQGELERRT
jgi:hypothetical protein